MSVIFLLIPLSMVVAGCFLVAFIWAVRSGQYEDTCTPSMRVLLDETRNPLASPSHFSNSNLGPVSAGPVEASTPNKAYLFGEEGTSRCEIPASVAAGGKGPGESPPASHVVAPLRAARVAQSAVPGSLDIS